MNEICKRFYSKIKRVFSVSVNVFFQPKVTAGRQQGYCFRTPVDLNSGRVAKTKVSFIIDFFFIPLREGSLSDRTRRRETQPRERNPVGSTRGVYITSRRRRASPPPPRRLGPGVVPSRFSPPSRGRFPDVSLCPLLVFGRG